MLDNKWKIKLFVILQHFKPFKFVQIIWMLETIFVQTNKLWVISLENYQQTVVE